jgi:outer membrane receptor for ferrienterochelin and colicins
MPVSSCLSRLRRRRAHLLALLLCAAALAHTAQAHEGPHSSPAGNPSTGSSTTAQSPLAVAKGWDFTLPTLNGDRFVRLRDATGPVLVNFWGVDCPPCVAELPMLLAFARAQPGWTLLLVGTDPPAAARAFAARLPQPLPPNVLLLRGAAQARALLRGAGSRHGGLPHSVALLPGSAEACAQHAGMLTDAWLLNTVAACDAPQPAKTPSRATPS